MLQRLVHDAAALGVALTEHDAARLRQLLEELARWNQKFNLTGLTDLESMVSHHVLDSLAVHRYLHGAAIADVGTGAGFPGLPLALVNPERRFTLIDSNGKKIRFVSHAVRILGVMNVEPLQARVETLRPERPFDTVLARAFAALPQLLAAVGPLCGSDTRVLAMKGKWPQAELDALPPGWRVAESHTLTVPGLAEARCLIVLMAGISH
ncbi:MAG TPA: 16S rRNA (guanine(527)-N(7))-methyltransferase RsmG [Steroidobacteraceae bacterium]|nr:16S rRNA (guanine(527)-N(7))-methyltransferase RsmG [Steroidobacteraceae bacterium]